MVAVERVRPAAPGPDSGAGAGGPGASYAARQARFAAERDALHGRWNRVANLRLLAFVLAAICAVGAVRAGSLPLGVLASVLFIAFLVLVRHHARLGTLRRRAEESRAVNEEAGWRLRREWARLPLRSSFRPVAGHPYAGDLDLFGPASLFHLLHSGGTPMGATTLRDWLLTAAAPEVALTRQAAVAELAGQLDLRDELQVSGRLVEGPTPDPAPFLRWAEGRPWLTARPVLVWLARLCPLGLWITLALWLTGIVTWPLWLLFLLGNEILWQTLGRRAAPQIAQIGAQASALGQYAGSFAALDGVPFVAPALTRLQADMAAEGVSAYGQMRRLERLSRFIVPATALTHGLMQRLILWDVQVLVALEGWQQAAGGRARRWLAALGEVEALAMLGGLAHAEPEWSYPDLDAAPPRAFAALALGHPLLAADMRVANDVTLGPPGAFLLVTGSNMSGKSTLLRAIGVNAVLAGAGGPVCARALRLPSVTLWTSMRIEDSLAQGVSYYMAELQRLKAVVDAARDSERAGGAVLLYLLDEILQGTNTAERQIAARRIIAHLVAHGAIGAISTHDLNLADAPEIAALARPIHFTEHFATGPEGPTMTFDYRLRPGIATSTNALRLMEIVGIDLDEG